MSRREEFVGVRAIDHVTSEGPCYAQWLTDEQIVRCRDCEWFTPERFYEEEREVGVVEILSEPPDCGNPERCSHQYDSLTKKIVPVHIVTDPNGFCAWGERRDG